MTVELTKRDLLNMLFSTEPSFEVMDSVPKDLGHFVGGMSEHWDWNTSGMHFKEDFDEEYGQYSEEFIWELYKKCDHTYDDLFK